MFFDQFHETKSRHLSSEPLTALKKQLFKFSWNRSKKFTFTQNFAFYEFKCYSLETPKFSNVYILKFWHRAFLNQCWKYKANFSWFFERCIRTRHAVFLGFSSFAQNQNFPQKFWAKTQNTQNFKNYEFSVFR